MAPDCFNQFIFRAARMHFPRSFRNSAIMHNLQMHDHIDGTYSRLFQRSIFGLIYTFNVLPQFVVEIASVSLFQRRLQRGLIQMQSTSVNWRTMLTCSIRQISVQSFQNYFINK